MNCPSLMESEYSSPYLQHPATGHRRQSYIPLSTRRSFKSPFPSDFQAKSFSAVNVKFTLE